MIEKSFLKRILWHKLGFGLILVIVFSLAIFSVVNKFRRNILLSTSQKKYFTVETGKELQRKIDEEKNGAFRKELEGILFDNYPYFSKYELRLKENDYWRGDLELTVNDKFYLDYREAPAALPLAQEISKKFINLAEKYNLREGGKYFSVLILNANGEVITVENEGPTTISSTIFVLPMNSPIPIEESENEKVAERSKQPSTPQRAYTYDPYYPIILSFSDNKGGSIKFSQYNQYPYSSQNTGITLKIGDTIRWKAEASDPKGRQILYNFHSNSQRFTDLFGRENGAYKFTPNNEIEYTITEQDLKEAGETLRIELVIKSEKENFRSGSSGYDDTTYLDYRLQPN